MKVHLLPHFLISFLLFLSCNKQTSETEKDIFTPPLGLDSLIKANPAEAFKKLDGVKATHNASYHLYLVRLYTDLKKYDEAFIELEKASEYPFENTFDSARYYYDYGKLYIIKQEYKKALDYLTVGISNTNIDKVYQGKYYILLGIVSNKFDDYRSAKSYYKKALGIYQNTSDSSTLGVIYHNLGNSYFNASEYDSAIFYTKKAIEIREKMNNLREVIVSKNVLSLHYTELKRLREAENIQKQIAQDALILGDSSAISYNFLTLGNIYRKSGLFNEAEYHALKSLDIAKKLEDYSLQLEDLRLLTSIALERKNNVRELRYYVEYDSLNTALQMKRQSNLVQETNNNIEIIRQLKDAEIKALKLEKVEKDKKLLQVQIILLVIICVIVIFLMYKSYKKYKQWLEIKKVENNLLLKDIDKAKLSEKEALEKLIVLGENMIEHKDIFDQILQEMNIYKKTKEINPINIELLIKNRDTKIDDRNVFIYYIQKIQEGFMVKIKQKYPSLTETETKLCGLLSLNLNSKKIATLLNVEVNTVEIYRHRLRKKLSLSPDDSLIDFLKSI